MKFLIDRCAGGRLAAWLRSQGHDVLEGRTLGPDPGDLALLKMAFEGERVLVTIDTDFGTLMFVHHAPHASLIRLPDVPSQQRIALMAQVLEDHSQDVESGAIITVKGSKIRISRRVF